MSIRKASTHKFKNKRSNVGALIPAKIIDRSQMVQKLVEVLTVDQLRLAAWYYVDGFGLAEIGVWEGSSKQRINHRLNRIEEKLKKHGIPLPRRMEHPYATNHVHNFNLLR